MILRKNWTSALDSALAEQLIQRIKSMKRHRKTHSGAFKAKVALEAVKGTRTLNEVPGQFEIHPSQVVQWKRRLVNGAPDLFNGADHRDALKEAASESLKATGSHLKFYN